MGKSHSLRFLYPMTYIILFRGINVGGNNKLPMKELKELLESHGYENVSTYLITGNIFVDSNKSREQIHKEITKSITKEFGLEIPTLVKTQAEINKIVKAIPQSWQNDKEQKSDVAFLFQEPARNAKLSDAGGADSKEIIKQLPFDLKYIEVKYVSGALLWNVTRENQNKSKLAKIVGTKLYQQMTVRNVNTARYLATHI